MDVGVRHLRVLIAVIDEGTYTAAASRLSITQPALTRTIQQLEAALGTRLLDRTSRTLHPTNEGAEFAERARAVLGDLDAAIAAAGRDRTVRLGFSWLLPDPWANDTINACEKRSGARVHIQRTDNPIDALESGTIDAAVVRGRVIGKNLVGHHLFNERRVAAVSTRSPLAKRSSIAWSELADLPLVVNTLTGTTRADSWHNPSHERDIVTCTNFDEWLELIAADRGVGAVPEVARRRVNHHNVTFLDLDEAPSTRVQLVYIRSRATPLLRILCDCAIDCAAKYGASAQ